jgi:hypothetical protein
MARAAMKAGIEHRYKDVIESITIADEAIGTSSLNPIVLEQLVVRWIVRCSVPFIMTETDEFCTLLNYLNP